MLLARDSLKKINTSKTELPLESTFDLPEKVLQFGTGVLLRGLPDYFINKANQANVFNGRVVVVKSTSQGDLAHFEQQDCLYTLCIRGLKDGKDIQDDVVISAISRVLSAQSQWPVVLDCAPNPHISIIISNTTEVGIQLVNEDIHQNPPSSFPAKLLRFLLERYMAFNGAADSGMIVLPTELLPGNGEKLKAIVLELAAFNKLDQGITNWIDQHNQFCNTLVDRIVPGAPKGEKKATIETELGYSDELLIISEVYSLWAIEGDELIKSKLSFSSVDETVVITPDISRFRELKLRMLNGTHTLSCAVSFLSGVTTVKEAMEDSVVSHYIEQLMLSELANSIPIELSEGEAKDYGRSVLDRFRNAAIEHPWINISVQYSSKLKMRCVPLLLTYQQRFNKVPQYLAFGFAAFVCFMRPVKEENGKYYGEFNGAAYPLQDDQAKYFYEVWQHHSLAEVANIILRDVKLWGTDLTSIPAFEMEVQKHAEIIMTEGIRQGLFKLRP